RFPCRSRFLASLPARCSPSPARWANSAQPSPSSPAFRARRARCRLRSTAIPRCRAAIRWPCASRRWRSCSRWGRCWLRNGWSAAPRGACAVSMRAVDIAFVRGGMPIAARFEAQAGVTALFGRSGAGKTSVLHAIAGLLRPERGSVRLGARCLYDSDRGIDVPVHRRRIGLVFQDARLLPHLSVRSNLLYGHRLASKTSRRIGMAQVVALLGLERLLERPPGSLSGGERQRVAIGRALLANPELLLMDEPLASLDGPRRGEILRYVERLRDELRVP